MYTDEEVRADRLRSLEMFLTIARQPTMCCCCLCLSDADRDRARRVFRIAQVVSDSWHDDPRRHHRWDRRLTRARWRTAESWDRLWRPK